MASRVVYNVCYVGLGPSSGRKVALARSVVWQAGIVMTLTLWVKAGLKMVDSYVF